MDFYGRFFRLVRFFFRFFFRIDELPVRDTSIEPCVFICRHKNMQGPVHIMSNFDVPVRVWVLDVFCERKTCFEQYYGYTFSKRLGWKPVFARSIAYLASIVVPRLMRSMGGIPVHRNSIKMMATFRKTIGALLNGENVIIFPDIDYRDTSDDVIELYDGYLLLDRMYRLKAKRALPFVALYVDEKGRRILKGEPVRFPDDGGDYEAQKSAVNEELIRQISALAKQAQKH